MSEPLSHLPNRFINWREGKVPCNPTGMPINHLDPGNWQTYAAASQSEYPVGFVVMDVDPWFFLDLDNCLDASGNWTPEATAIYGNFSGAMAEVSQSGRGLHIVGKCNKQMLKDRRNKWGGQYEFYMDSRFIAFGPHGWHWIGGAENPNEDWTQNLQRIVPQREFDPGGEMPAGRDPAWDGPEDDDELIRRMLQSTGGALGAFGVKATVADLWNRDENVLARFYPADGERPDGLNWDWSSAEFALCNHLAFWTGNDMQRMDRLFRRSGLMRDKWEKRDDIRMRALSGAIRGTTETYKQSSRAAPTDGQGGGPISTDKLLLVPDLVKYFEGYYWVRDQNRMLTPDGKLIRPEQFRADRAGKQFQLDITNTAARSITDDAFKAFTGNLSHDFPKVHDTFWDPKLPFGTIVKNRVNTWIPPDVETKDGDPEPFLHLLRTLLPNERDQKIFLNWAASIVQNPGVKFQWAPVIQGAEGNGKTLLSDFVAMACGVELTHKPDAKNLTEKYNGYLEGKTLIIVEEIDMADKRDVMDTLKPLITNLRVEIRGMAREKRMIALLANWIFLTNHRDAINKTHNDRRYSVFFTAQQCAEDIIRDGMGGSYFPEMWAWAWKEGFAIVAKYLREFEIDPELDPAGSCHRAPITSTTEEVIKAGMGRVEAEILNEIESGTQGFRGNWVSSIKLLDFFKDRGIRIGFNRFAELMSNLGYEPCPSLKNGRASRPIQLEGNKRPVLYYKKGEPVPSDPTGAYLIAQLYTAP